MMKVGPVGMAMRVEQSFSYYTRHAVIRQLARYPPECCDLAHFMRAAGV